VTKRGEPHRGSVIWSWRKEFKDLLRGFERLNRATINRSSSRRPRKRSQVSIEGRSVRAGRSLKPGEDEWRTRPGRFKGRRRMTEERNPSGNLEIDARWRTMGDPTGRTESCSRVAALGESARTIRRLKPGYSGRNFLEGRRDANLIQVSNPGDPVKGETAIRDPATRL